MTLLVFGMDGAVEEWVDEAIDRGLMPNLEKFREQGCFGKMDSTTPPITIPAWVSMFSGLQPDKFDTYHMTEMNPDYSRSSITSSRWQGEMLWDKLEGEFGLINVPGTSPLWPVNGYVFEGFPMVEDPSVYPESLKEKLPEFDFVEKDGQATRERRRQAFFTNFHKRKEIFDKIDEDADVRIEVYQLTDTTAHRSKNLDQIMEAYEEVDKVLGKRMEEYDDILLVSDHGFTHIDKMFYVNTWLENRGLLNQKTGSDDSEEDKSSRTLMDRIQKLLSPLAETRLRPVLKLGNDLLNSTAGVDFSPGRKGVNHIDFENTKAFSFRGGGNNHGDINLNDEKFEKGVEMDREKVLDRIENELREEEFIAEVWRREDLYDEPENMPEIVFKTTEDTGVGSSLFTKELFKTDAFIHSETGIVGARGKSFKQGRAPRSELVDVAPTIAHYIGQELDVDGEVIDIFAEDFEPEKPSSTENLNDLDI
ncbi:MAG: putative AlkP superfamily phosphohydrolase/phosphomutase [Candidatus Nanohaloarchaea archaeon]|jgi:predicted AlkP superfamily phosphohydrolase/phosphomutase